MRAKPPNVTAWPTAKPAAFLSGKWLGLAGGLLFLFTIVLYGPSYRAGFIWDDKLLLENPLVQGGWPGLRDIWTTKKFPDFCPVTATSFWLEAQLGGATAVVRHTTNILLQGGNVVLLWLVLRRLKIPGAWAAAAIFAAHPLCVTSVTWMAERKNTLSLFFYLLSFWFFLRSEKTDAAKMASHFRSAAYWFSFFCYAAALLSKTSTVVLPVVFLLGAWWRSGKISRSDVQRALPFFGLAFTAGLATLIAHYFFGPKDGVTDSLLVRVLAGTKAIWFYIGKALWPMNLTMHYGRWEIDPRSFAAYWPGLGLLAGGVVCWRFRPSGGKAVLFGLGYFIIALAPTLGIAKMTFLKFSQVADHFQFLALPGLIALVVGGVFHWAKNAKRTLHFCTVMLLAVVLPTLAMQSWKHQHIVGDAETLWRDNLQKNPTSWLACYGVATALQARGERREAETYYRQAIAMRPDYLDALSNLGVLLGGQGRWPEAMECYRKALAFNPNVGPIHFNLGTALYAQNKFAEAVEPLRQAVALEPGNSQYRNNLASALMQAGKIGDETMAYLREAVRLHPANGEAQANLGLLLSRQGKNQEAQAQYERALQIDPGNASAHHYCGLLLASRGQNAQALEHFEAAARLQPQNVSALQKAMEAAQAAGRNDVAKQYRDLLEQNRNQSIPPFLQRRNGNQ